MSESQKPASSAIDTVQFDIPCVNCQYNLRGLPADGRCPECGHRVSVSILEYWRNKRSRRSLSNVSRGTLKQQLTGCVLSATAIVVGLLGWIFESWSALDALSHIGSLVTGLAWLLSAAGAWFVLTPMPQDRLTMRYRIIRLTLVVHLICLASAVMASSSVYDWGRMGTPIFMGIMAGVFVRIAIYGACAEIFERAELPNWNAFSSIAMILTAISCCVVAPMDALSGRAERAMLHSLPLLQCPPLSLLNPGAFVSQQPWAYPLLFAAIGGGVAIFIKAGLVLWRALMDIAERDVL